MEDTGKREIRKRCFWQELGGLKDPRSKESPQQELRAEGSLSGQFYAATGQKRRLVVDPHR